MKQPHVDISASPHNAARPGNSLLLTKGASFRRRLSSLVGQSLLLLITSVSTFAVLFIFIYIIRDALPFFQERGIFEFLTTARWYPSNAAHPEFGALAIIYGSFIVTIGAVIFAVPLGITAAVCLSDVLPFSARQFVKPVIEMLASIPSVAYGFFALVVFAPMLQNHGGGVIAVCVWAIGGPIGILAGILLGEILARRVQNRPKLVIRMACIVFSTALLLVGIYFVASSSMLIKISSGTNALNVSIILGVMVLPTIVSVSEDALQAAGRELREASYALGATRAETMLHVIIPAASSGIAAAIILGLMRAVGETMVVWMASGNAPQMPSPIYSPFEVLHSFIEPVRTLTATIAGDMGEADQVTGSARYHVLFAMALLLLVISFACNLASEWAVRRERMKLRGE